MIHGPVVFTPAGLRRGAVVSLPLLIGLAPFGIVCGITQQAAGLSLGETMLMAGLVYAGSAQLVVLAAWTHPPSVLAATLMERRGFSKEGFALNHPAGSLGARLLKVEALMHTDWPKLVPGASTIEVLDAITAGHLGMATVQEDGKLLGVISDGDIRRAFKTAEQRAQNPLHLTAADFMSRNPISTGPGTLAVEAASRMETRKVTFLVVADGEGAPVGVLHIHDLLTHKVL